MAKVVVGAEVTVGTDQASKSVGSLKQQLREAQADVAALSEKFGATSTAAINAAKKAAQLKDAIGDAKALTDAFNPDRKFQAFSQALQGVAGGFAAVQGAQALFGSESEDLQKTLVKVQAAMSLSQGINSIMEAEDSFKILGSVIKTNVVGAFSTLKGAIISTGIGALIVAVGILVNQMSEMADAAEEAAKAQEKLNEQTKRFADIGLKTNLEALNRQEKVDIARAKLAGKSEEDIFNIQQDYRKRRLEVQTAHYNEIKNADKDAAQESLNIIKNGIADGQAAQAEFILKQREQRKQDNKDAQKDNEDKLQIQKEGDAAIRKAQQDSFLAGIKDDQERSKEQLRIDYENKKLEIEQSKYSATQKAELLKQASIKYWIDLKTIDDEAAAQKEKDDLDRIKKENDRNKKAAEENLKIEQELADAKQGIRDAELDAVSAGIGILKMLGEKNKDVQKIALLAENGLAIARTIIGAQTAIAAARANMASINPFIANPAGLPLVNPAYVKAQVIGNANILKTKIGAAASIATIIASTAKGLAALGGGSAGGGNVGGGEGGTAAPIAPQIGGTQLNQQQVNQLSNAANRAFVLESDITGNQERIERLNRAARIN